MCAVCTLCSFSHNKFSSDNCVTTYWQIHVAAHSAYGTFPLYKYLIANLVFPTLGFSRGDFFLIAIFPDYGLLS